MNAAENGRATLAVRRMCSHAFAREISGTGQNLQVTRPFLPGGFEQTTFFHVSTAEVIAVEVGTFRPVGSFHG